MAAFCPVCGVAGAEISPQCFRVAKYYGYSPEVLARLSQEGASIAVPFFDIKRFFFALERLARNPLARAMEAEIERSSTQRPPSLEYGNAVTILPFRDAASSTTELYLKEDVSKAMVVYQHEDALEHFGAEERAVLFAELTRDFFGLGELVPTTVFGLSAEGTKFIASAGLSKDRFRALADAPRADLREVWGQGLVPRVALLDFVLGQGDRHAGNVLFTADARPQLGLIDNDDAFPTHERLSRPFAYLPADARGLDLGGAARWFEPFRLAELVGQLTPLALPEELIFSLCRRFVFARYAAAGAMPLEAFVAEAFAERGTWRELHKAPWTTYRSLVLETRGATRYRVFVGEQRGGVFELTVLEGTHLQADLRVAQRATFEDAADAERAIVARSAEAAREGYAHVLRRRFFVTTAQDDASRKETCLVEVWGDPSGFHVQLKRGQLGRYETRTIERLLSFDTAELALGSARAIERELKAHQFIDLRGRLESFKAPPAPVLF